jgi:hypothetical protein
VRFARILIKPDGFTRVLTEDEATCAIIVWNGLLDHLSGQPPSPNTPSELITELPRKIERRLGYRSGYDLAAWSLQARSTARCRALAAEIHDVPELAFALLTSLDLRRDVSISGQLTHLGIHGLYAASSWFVEDQEGLVEYLTSGPVVFEYWRGQCLELALVAKFAVRWALGVAGRRNLIHCDLVENVEHPTQMLRASSINRIT